jgi:hypothetical protein
LLHEWKLDGEVRNLGDALGEFLVPREYKSNSDNMYFPIGSVICNQVMDETLRQGHRPVFIDCGWRGTPLDQRLTSQCEFVGSRGPLTRRALKKVGVHVDVTLDSAYRIPNIIEKGNYHGKRIFVPHILDPKRLRYSPQGIGVDEIIQPVVTNKISIVETVKKISGASFVFAGAMHAGILAHAYGVPFGLASIGYVNCPSKYDDWLQSIGVTSTGFYMQSKDAERWWLRNVS